MEIKFENNLEYQDKAVDSIVKIFQGQENVNNLNIPFISEFGVIKNQLSLSEKEIYENLIEIQKQNKVSKSVIHDEKLVDGKNFSIEMETGTGKTYVYIKTIMELNQKYGFKKFIIVVPSVAIREGVIATLKSSKNHFKKIYDNVMYKYYEYDSSKLSQLRQFVRNNNIEVMVMTLDSINKESNIMNQVNDKLNGQKPIELVSSTNPILILDEPQNMESDISKKAIESLDPSFILRYSATHKNYYNLVYRLSPVEAYDLGLVKKIDVLSVVKDDDYNNVFINCLDIKHVGRKLKTEVEVFKKENSGTVKLKKIKLEHGEDLFEKTGVENYRNFVIEDIDLSFNTIRFTNGVRLIVGQNLGGDKEVLMKEQIKLTIIEHFEKQLRLKDKGLKVLSLFFIDKVDNYLNDEGFIRKTFIEEFKKIKNKYPEFKELDVEKVHKGYFSEKKTDSAIEKDKETFDLIMRDKETLLSFDEPTQFIFSHSALREGWDNPNVFNICTLNSSVSNIRKRQEIGRGVRLPVNQEGVRIKDQDLAKLTVIANESYKDYVSKLQTEYDEENQNQNIKDRVKDATKRTKVRLKKGFELNPEFKEIWERISKKTKYSLKLDSEKLIEKAINIINSNVSISETKIKKTKISLDLKKEGYDYLISKTGSSEIDNKYVIPNVIDLIENETKLTRKTILKILLQIENLNQLYLNPQEFISQVIEILQGIKRTFLVEGIQYLPIGENWKMELFKDFETYSNAVVKIEKSIYEEVSYDSKAEMDFALELEKIEDVKLYIKLPGWFVVNTPIGNYNPDWAIVLEKEGVEKLYLIRETKFIEDDLNLRPNEQMKINCAEAHFKTIDVNYKKLNLAKESFNEELY